MSTPEIGAPLREACLRLAWYVQKHGPIPDAGQKLMMFTVMNQQFGRALTEEQQSLADLAQECAESFTEMYQK